MLKLYVGGSPCTAWSIAQTKNRETEPSGLGWELFKNYLIGMEKYNPTYFLYENNKSMAPAIREQITKELGVEPILINSALVSAQNRQRLYWTNIPGVTQPKDRGILLRDVLESTTAEKGYALAKTQTESGASAKYLLKNFTYPTEKACTLTASCYKGVGTDGMPMVAERWDGKTYPVYEVRNGLITIKDKQYPIKLADGFYIIRKLTVTECKRLQTVPDSYIFPVSNSHAYKMLGNGWTVDVIAHILSHVPDITTEPVEVLSMYDGMSCGHIALDKLGANVVRYYATEIDKYAIQTTATNYPTTVHLGDAFQVREEGWRANHD